MKRFHAAALSTPQRRAHRAGGREAPLCGPRGGLDPWIISSGWVDNWVLDMCDHRDPPAWMQDRPAPRPLWRGLGTLIVRASFAFPRRPHARHDA